VEKKAIAQKLDGTYVMKTDRKDMTADEIWRTYILLTRVGRLPGHQEPAHGAPDFPSPAKPDTDTHLPVRPGLSSPGSNRTSVPAAGDSHFMVDSPSGTQHPPGRYHRFANDGWPGYADPEGDRAGTYAPRNLLDTCHSHGDHSPSENLA
jgi:hypothetical protein